MILSSQMALYIGRGFLTFLGSLFHECIWVSMGASFAFVEKLCEIITCTCNQTLWLPNPLVCRVSLLLQRNRWEHHRRGVFSEPREVPPRRFFPHFFSARMWDGTKGRSTCQTWISVDRVMNSEICMWRGLLYFILFHWQYKCTKMRSRS